MAMRAIWQRYCQGKAPAALSLDKEGHAWFEGAAQPETLAFPIPDQSTAPFSFSLNGKITVMDHGATLTGGPRLEAMLHTGAYAAVIIDPTGDTPPSPGLTQQADIHYFPRQVLGDGKAVHLHACLDPALSATLAPRSSGDQNVQVLASIPMQSRRIDDIEGLQGLDWLTLDDRHDALAILEGGRKSLENALALQVRIAFLPTHEGQADMTALTHWMNRHGFAFHQFSAQRCHSHFPENLRLAKSHSSQLISADALFLPDAARLNALSADQCTKLAFILHTHYGAHDLAYHLLARADATKAQAYLRELGYLTEPAKETPRANNDPAATNPEATAAEQRVTALRLPVKQARHRLPGRLVVTLTSYGARFPTLHLTLKSLLAQDMRADRTVLWIAEGERTDLPTEVLSLQDAGLDIRFCEDIRSYKKIIPTLAEEPDSFIVTADDDFYYEPGWLAGLVQCWDGHAKTVVAHRAHRIRTRAGDAYPEAYRLWEWQITNRGETSDRLFPTSGSGVLYPPGAFDAAATDKKAFLSLCPDADDVWLYWMCRRTGCRVKTSGQRPPYINWPGTQENTLWHQNLLQSGNDRQINAMLAAYGLPYETSTSAPAKPKPAVASRAGETDDICSFHYEGVPIHFYLPDPKDHIQRIIRSNKTFYEGEMLRDIRNRVPTKTTILDIGANIGNHTVFFAKLCKAARVYAFEPQQHVFDTLVRNIGLNGSDEHVRCLNLGLGRASARASLGAVDEANLGMTKIDLSAPGEVQIVPLDEFLEKEGNPAIGLVKMDVEGMEMEVLAGATRTLAEWGPIIYAEAGTPPEFQRLDTFLTKFGYRVVQRFNATATYLFMR
jgi:FkbM family methyltransferase